LIDKLSGKTKEFIDMKKAGLLLALLGTFAAITLQAKTPEKRDTTKIQSVVVLTEQKNNDTVFLDDEITLIDTAKVGIGGENLPLIPADDLYNVWNNAISDPYRLPIDSIISPNDTIVIPIESYTYPLLTHIRVNSEFGKRGRRFHNGIDLKVYTGDTIVSSMAGMVRIARKSGAFGNLVVVRHHNGLETFYGHLSKILVKQDQRVESGEVIGLGGNTGRSTGPHLHYEVRYLGKSINPRHLVDFDSTLTAKSDTLLLTADLFKHISKQTYSAAGSTSSAPALKAGEGGVWTVRSGDTLGRIAQRTGTSISYLCNVNGISRTGILKPGQKIKY
jgi:murein DD-endopeptidase MepM/ murein hydrolase activator NlpD